jgi:hypothetical protein
VVIRSEAKVPHDFHLRVSLSFIISVAFDPHLQQPMALWQRPLAKELLMVREQFELAD